MRPGIKSIRGHQPDYVLALLVFILLSIGMVMMYSMSPVLSHKLIGSAERNYFFYSTLGNIAVGLVAWLVVANINYQAWKRWAPILLIGAMITMALLFIPGLSFAKNGATRWLKVGPLSFQPAEALKLATVLYLGVWLEKKGEGLKTLWEGLVPFSIMLFSASFALVVLQRDMGTMMVLALTAMGMYYVAGANLRHAIGLLMSAAALGWVSIITFPHRMARFSTFLDPQKDPTGQGYHLNQALIAIGSGGLFGVGLGKSIQVHGYLPEAANDSIFAIIAEEFGYAGSVITLLLFGILVFRGFRVARLAPDTFSRLVALGISLWLLFQTIINVAAMVALVPLTGIPLPFISYGGTSLLFSLVAAGILLNISKYTLREVSDEGTGERRRNGWAYFSHTSNSRRIKVAR
jgi:cell division protein FtsW